MKKYILIFMLVMMIGVVSAEDLIFAQNENINYRFRCLDQDNNYCSSATILLISLEYPNGTNALNNISMTFNETYFNITLPTNSLGLYKSIIVSPTINGTVSEFVYEVTSSGGKVSLSNTILVIIFIVIAVMLFLIGLSFEKEKFVIKTSFFIFSLFSILLGLNSARIIASESLGLFTMSTTGIILIITIILLMLLYVFIHWTIDTFKKLKEKKGLRWKY